MLEAMAMRRNLVVSDVGAVRDLPDSLRGKMDIVPADTLAESFPQALRKRIEANDDWPDYEPEYTQVFSPHSIGMQWREFLVGGAS
jgi:hypothetical protein